MPDVTTVQFGPLRLEASEGVRRIVLADGAAGNPLGGRAAQALRAAAAACDEDSGTRAVLILAEGPSFSVGGDLQEMSDDETPSRTVRQGVTDLNAAISMLTRMDAPLVVVVQGVAAGAGMALTLAGDIVLASPEARFTMAYTRVGLSPDGGSTFFLPRLVGLRKALELTLLSPVLSCAEAEQLGLVTRVVPGSELRSEGERLATMLAEGPTQALGRAASLLRASFSETLETQMELEARGVVTSVRSEEGREGRDAFLSKRRPVYSRGNGDSDANGASRLDE